MQRSLKIYPHLVGVKVSAVSVSVDIHPSESLAERGGEFLYLRYEAQFQRHKRIQRRAFLGRVRYACLVFTSACRGLTRAFHSQAGSASLALWAGWARGESHLIPYSSVQSVQFR